MKIINIDDIKLEDIIDIDPIITRTPVLYKTSYGIVQVWGYDMKTGKLIANIKNHKQLEKLKKQIYKDRDDIG